jgi:hypothetical protein
MPRLWGTTRRDLAVEAWQAQCRGWSIDWTAASPLFATQRQAEVALELLHERIRLNNGTPWPEYRVHRVVEAETGSLVDSKGERYAVRIFGADQCPCLGERAFAECHGRPR